MTEIIEKLAREAGFDNVPPELEKFTDLVLNRAICYIEDFQDSFDGRDAKTIWEAFGLEFDTGEKK